MIEEKACSKCGTVKPSDQFYKSATNKSGLACQCKACCKEAVRAWTVRNKPRVYEIQKKSNKLNIEHFRERRRRYRAHIRLTQPAKYRSRKRVCNIQRFFALRDATPEWVKMSDIIAIHKLAAEMQERDGIKYHVDHIFPLRGDGFCGLNVPWNLQVIPARKNLLKRTLINAVG